MESLLTLYEWARSTVHSVPVLAGWVAGLSAIAFIGSLIAVPLLITHMSADYFVRSPGAPGSWARLHPVLRVLLVGTKNLLGTVLVVAGIAMLVLPGQGLLSILIGASLTDFPGKRRLELALIKRAPVLRAVNWIRHRAHRPPLILP